VTNMTVNEVTGLVRRARAAMEDFSGVSQDRLDEAVTALAWSLYKPETAKSLAEFAVEITGLGNVESKVIKNQRKTFGTLRDLLRVKSTGIIEEIPEKGLVKYAKPVGVVAAVCPSTNPSATPVNKAMMAIKGGNAVVIAPSPMAWPVTNATVEAMRGELAKIGAPEDLVQILPQPVTRELTSELMGASDLVVVTGSQNNVRRAYTSGKPAIGVGAGNAPVIIDATADLDDAAEKICASKIFDNATSCSSENSVIVLDEIYDDAIAALTRAGGYMASSDEGIRIVDLLWQDGKLNRNIIAKDANILADAFELSGDAKSAKFLVKSSRWSSPFTGQKTLPTPSASVRKFSIIWARAIPSASTQRTWIMPARLPRTLTWCGCWSIRHTHLAMAAASTTACPSHCPWAAERGRGIPSPTI